MFREKAEKETKNEGVPSTKMVTHSQLFSNAVFQLRMEDRQRFHLLQELLAELEGMEQ